MNISKIAILDYKNRPFIEEHHIKGIKEVVPAVEVVYALSANELLHKAPDADILVTYPYVEGVIDYCKNAKNLKLIHSVISGVDILVNSEIRDMDIRITSTKGIHGFPMADHVLAYIYSFLRALPVFGQSQRNKEWNEAAQALCDETFGKTVGIIGLGKIGEYIAKKCKLLDFRVIALKRTPVQNQWIDKCYSTSETEQFMKEADFVVAIIPLTSETKNMIGEKEFGMMKKSAYFINIARGGIVDEVALVNALKAKEIAGAGLDVFVNEPLQKDSPLWDMPNVILTPHAAAQSPFYNDRAFKVLIENLQRYIRGEELLFESERSRSW
ncbi:D-2-hydroxyacid dehydrogenase [Desulfitobacterium sp.]|uniref:D-2-hydroxyacid dehydrogenase n=1 Tax=Desulfitobacterium sp. TaxID=49981 RepID=UPI002BB641F8|nr:D-2-hydroxyacid dehydrogenase [Desulfitobacterium sp.]HVJ48241.1 D-2-hydroxyacid dehydrogenase [Desulfitobacterium sp.]